MQEGGSQYCPNLMFQTLLIPQGSPNLLGGIDSGWTGGGGEMEHENE